MTMHKEFFEELRATRQQKGITLDDISRTTLIDKKYLEAIEGGNEGVLPAAYVRAFIREYAAAIGLNPDEVMKKFGQPKPAETAPETQQSAGPPTAAVPAAIPPAEPKSARQPWWENRTLLLSVISVAVVCIIAVILDVSKRRQAPDVPEIPFSTAVREAEQRTMPGDTTKPRAQLERGAATDSLVLSVASIDSVWMELSIDGTPAIDYLFPPNARRQWKAKEKFTVTLGNAGGILFRLNGTELGTLGKRGSVLHNVELSRKTLTQPRSTEGAP
jgi:transcriptional regulator with XRE-family HTH domain